MPPQKNSGNKKGKRETNVSVKNRQFVADLIYDLRKSNQVEDVYLGRVVRKLGNGRVEVFYVAKEIEKTFDHEGNDIVKESYKSYEKQATIKGSFRGKGKHSVWIDVGTPVVLLDSGLNLFTIIAVLSREQLQDISKEVYLDPRVLNGIVETSENPEDTVEFEEETKNLSDGDIDNI